MKQCTRCKRTKPLTEFSPRKGVPDGRAYRCKTCQNEVVKDAYVPTERSQRRRSDWETRTKVCSTCNVRKSFDDYSKRAGRRDYQSYCKSCDSDYQRLKKYGLSKQGFDELLEQQDGCCASCGDVITFGTGKFAVDHCHGSGQVRGILCSQCNLALGYLKDDPDRISRLLAYISRTIQTDSHSSVSV